MSDLADFLLLVPAMKERFATARGRYDTLNASVRQEVVRYEWTDGARYALEPLHFELGAGGAPGKVFRVEPKRKRSGTHRYGFSASGQVLLEEQFTEFPGQVYECFWEWSEGPSATLYDYYTPEKTCINVQQLFLVDGVPRAYIRYAKMGVLVSTFEYADSRVVRMQQHNRMHDPGMPPSYSFTRELLLHYSGHTLWEVDATYEDGSRTRILERGELL